MGPRIILYNLSSHAYIDSQQLMYPNLVICHNAIRKGKHFGGNKILVDCDGRSSRHHLAIAIHIEYYNKRTKNAGRREIFVI